jgi:hypothetical protein
MIKKHRQETKRLVGVLIAQGKSIIEISERLKLTPGQVTHIKDYYYGTKKQRMKEYMQKYTKTPKMNTKVEPEVINKVNVVKTKSVKNIKVNSPISRIINFNGLEIEISNDSIKKVLITEKNKIKIL